MIIVRLDDISYRGLKNSICLKLKLIIAQLELLWCVMVRNNWGTNQAIFMNYGTRFEFHRMPIFTSNFSKIEQLMEQRNEYLGWIRQLSAESEVKKNRKKCVKKQITIYLHQSLKMHSKLYFHAYIYESWSKLPRHLIKFRNQLIISRFCA